MSSAASDVYKRQLQSRCYNITVEFWQKRWGEQHSCMISAKAFLEQRILKLKLPGAGFLFAHEKKK